ncbi:MAG: DMT family transporter [Desulfobacteraceae bacterium]|nr:DMT family transporter [Desulfobacteraceae bacterium]
MRKANKRDPGTASSRIAYLLLTLAPLCWAGNVVLARGVVELIPPVSFAFWRWTLAFVIVFPFFFQHAKKDWSVAVRHWKILILISLLGISTFNTLLYTAVHTTTAINAALIQSTMPAFIILMTLALYGESVNGLQLVGVGSCILGACIVVLRGKLGALLEVPLARGDFLMVTAVVIYAAYSALLRRRPPIRPTSFLVYTFGIGAVGLLPVYLWELSKVGPFPVTLPVGMSILYVALFPSVVAYFGWNRGIDLIGPNRGGLFINLIPVFASAMAVAWLGESLKTYHGVGMALIAGGMIVFNRNR